jgi:DNA-binding transcriptional ArsR family regulator
MAIYSNITTIASLIGDSTRTTILMALFDGKALPAGELARLANVSPQTASNHLVKLVEGGLVTVEAWSRHRYYRLASPDVAKVLEAIASIAPPAPVRSLRKSDQAKALRFARTCYDHIAGELGVGLTRALVNKGYLEEVGEGYLLTATGESWLREFGIEESKIHKARPVIPWHIDWTERVHHMAGPLALAVTRRLFELGWIVQGQIRRSIVVTERGQEAFQREFGLRSLPSQVPLLHNQ